MFGRKKPGVRRKGNQATNDESTRVKPVRVAPERVIEQYHWEMRRDDPDYEAAPQGV